MSYAFETTYRDPLLEQAEERVAAAALRRWKALAATAGLIAVGALLVTINVVQDRSALQAQLAAMSERTLLADPRTSHQLAIPATNLRKWTAEEEGDDECTAAGKDVWDNPKGKSLPCCKGLDIVPKTCRGTDTCNYCQDLSTCTSAGRDVFDNPTGHGLPCCKDLVETPTRCRGGEVCNFCQDVSQCTQVGKDIYENPSGGKLPCCAGLVESTDKCRGTDTCHYCVWDVRTIGPRQEYPPAKISIDPATPKEAVDKHKAEGVSLIWSDEFKDLYRTKSMWVFEDIPYGVPGNTGDVNIVSVYSSDTISLIEGGGLRLSAYMAPEDEVNFMKGWNGTWNTNWGSDVSLWGWHAPKVTSRLNGRFQYGLIETRIKSPKGYGPWPAAWLNGCYGFVSEGTLEFLLQDDYPFLCGQYWPPELDFFEHFSPEHTWYWRPNSMSLHSPNQYVGLGKAFTQQGGYCPTTLAPPGEAWCFGVSGAGQFLEDPTEKYMNFAMKWDPDGVDYYMNDVFMHRFTTDHLVMYLSGQNRPIVIPEMPMFMTFNIALVRKGMDLSHGGEGLTDKANYDRTTGKWKPMQMDIEYFRVYQDDSQGETRGLNPPITYQTRRKLLANRVTCNLVPELRCMVKNSGSDANSIALANKACSQLKSLGDDYCDHIPKLCALNNAGNPDGAYGMSNVTIAQFANQRLSLFYGQCCVEEDKHCVDDVKGGCSASDKPTCRDTPTTKMPQWLLDSEYFQDPKLMYAKEGFSSGLAGTNPAGWKNYGMGLPRVHFGPHGEAPPSPARRH